MAALGAKIAPASWKAPASMRLRPCWYKSLSVMSGCFVDAAARQPRRLMIAQPRAGLGVALVIIDRPEQMLEEPFR